MTERRADDNIQCAQHHTSCSSTTASTYFISLSLCRARVAWLRCASNWKIRNYRSSRGVKIRCACLWNRFSPPNVCTNHSAMKWSALLESAVSICSRSDCSFYRSNFQYAFMNVLSESIYVHRRPCFALAFLLRFHIFGCWNLYGHWFSIMSSIQLGPEPRKTYNSVCCPMNVTAGRECFRLFTSNSHLDLFARNHSGAIFSWVRDLLPRSENRPKIKAKRVSSNDQRGNTLEIEVAIIIFRLSRHTLSTQLNREFNYFLLITINNSMQLQLAVYLFRSNSELEEKKMPKMRNIIGAMWFVPNMVKCGSE